MKKARDELGVSFLELNWEDTTSFSIEEQDLVKSVEYVHRARMGGGGVLIHCAQVVVCVRREGGEVCAQG